MKEDMKVWKHIKSYEYRVHTIYCLSSYWHRSIEFKKKKRREKLSKSAKQNMNASSPIRPMRYTTSFDHGSLKLKQFCGTATSLHHVHELRAPALECFFISLGRSCRARISFDLCIYIFFFCVSLGWKCIIECRARKFITHARSESFDVVVAAFWHPKNGKYEWG